MKRVKLLKNKTLWFCYMIKLSWIITAMADGPFAINHSHKLCH